MSDHKVVAVFHGRLREGYERHLSGHWPAFVGSFAEQCNGPLTHFSANYYTKPVGMGQCSTVTFRRGWTRLTKQLECNNVQGLDCWNMSDTYTNAILSARFGAYFSIDGMTMTVVTMVVQEYVGGDAIVSMCSGFDSLASEFDEYLAVAYGYMFSLPADSYPVCYALGFPHADATEEMKDDSANWNPALSADRIRNVYPVNLLGSKHLSLRVGGLALSDWIACDSRRGRLVDLRGGLHLWAFAWPLGDPNEVNFYCPEVAHTRATVLDSEAVSWSLS